MAAVGDIILAYSGLTLGQAILLMAFVFAFLALIGWIISSYGIHTKWFTIGGGRKESRDMFFDSQAREELKRKIDEIDADTVNSLYDLARQVSRDFNSLLHKGHCYFTLYQISDVFKDALKTKIRRNNLKNTLRKSNKNNYIEQLLGIIQEEYEDVRMKSLSAKCSDLYPDFLDIKGDVRICIEYFFDHANLIEVSSCERKIQAYTSHEGEFKIKQLKKKYCDEPRERNQTYLTNLKN